MRCFFPGSFDPPTVGHLDLIRRAARLFDEVVVGIMINPDKKCLFTPGERVELLTRCCEGVPGVRVLADSGLTVDAARRCGAQVILRPSGNDRSSFCLFLIPQTPGAFSSYARSGHGTAQ